MRLPLYGVAGVLVMLASEAGMLAKVQPFYSWHTPIAWSGYILFVDGLVRARRGSSWLTSNTAEFTFLSLLSIPLWVVFELYNKLIENWHYINLPTNLALRYFGYAWAFATIWPAIFETAELVAVWRRPRESSRRPTTDRSVSGALLTTVAAAGAVMLVWPIVRPSPYLAAPIWLGFILLLDPINHWLQAESFVGDLEGRVGTDRLVNLIVAGFVCGVLWECWNYWSLTKWIYTVPIMQNLKIFEMPLPGYLGFPAFALECFTMYVFVRRLVWPGSARAIGT